MILDPNGIASHSGQTGVAESAAADKMATKTRGHSDEKVPLLLFRAGDGAPKAVPLALVARLEEIERKAIETSNGRWVVQYRGQLMPLINLDPSQMMAADGQRQPVLVFQDGEH